MLLAVLLTLGIPAGAFASDRFTDVPTDSIFHSAINAIAGAGITLGCGGTNYCPSANVNREQMAAFMHRGLGRVAMGTWGYLPIGFSYGDASVLTIKAGEATGGTALVKVDGSVTLYAADSLGCPCQADADIAQDGGAISHSVAGQISAVASSGYGVDTVYVTYVFQVPSGTTQTFRLRVFRSAGTGMYGVGQLTAVYAPFGSQGTSVP